jgi:pilus assembly protein Flp/PilA
MNAGPSPSGSSPVPTFRRPRDEGFTRRLIRSRRAATATEYALIAALISVAAITAMLGVGTSVETTLNNAAVAVGSAEKSGGSFNVL